MGVRVVVPMQALPGKRQELIEHYAARCAEVRNEPGCEEYELFQSAEDPDKMALMEYWKDEATLEDHGALNRQRAVDTSHLRDRRGPSERYVD